MIYVLDCCIESSCKIFTNLPETVRKLMQNLFSDNSLSQYSYICFIRKLRFYTLQHCDLIFDMVFYKYFLASAWLINQNRYFTLCSLDLHKILKKFKDAEGNWKTHFNIKWFKLHLVSKSWQKKIKTMIVFKIINTFWYMLLILHSRYKYKPLFWKEIFLFPFYLRLCCNNIFI